jgi:3-dehydroquinate dehydratase/shikimate dehydrogenase
MALFGKGIRRICAVVAAETASEMAEQIGLALQETPTVELRLDYLRSDAERTKFLKWLAEKRFGDATFLATCRRLEGGGLFRGSAEAELDWLRAAGKAGCGWCDLEIETVRHLKGRSVSSLGIGPRVLLSAHDFRRTPGLAELVPSRLRHDAAAIKIAAQANTIADSFKFLRAISEVNNCVAVPMGEIGLPARILALRAGSLLAYAPVVTSTAPGQVSLRDLKHLYRAHELNHSTKLFGVIGNPIGHSLSPLLHNTGFITGKLNAVYLPFLVEDMHDFLKAIPELGGRGFSVTLPHKTAILKHLRECDPLAAEIGAVNTVTVHKDGSLFGCNTDYVGVLRSLEKKFRLRDSRVLILGAGGSARAAAFALARAGAHVVICARNPRAAQELARTIQGEAILRQALRTEYFDAILNATPVGMYPHSRISPLEPRELNCRIVMDLIYRPERTQLLQTAAKKGISTVSGVEMFLAQGIAQWELWMKQAAPATAMSKAIRAALRSEGPTGAERIRRRA